MPSKDEYLRMNFLRVLMVSVLVLFFIHGDLHATHNRAGEITYEQIGSLTIRVTITTYTRTRGSEVDRNSLPLFWGDGKMDSIPRVNGPGNQGELLPNDVKKNIYIMEHTYPGFSTYTLSVSDPNRIAGILNVDFPNSVNIPFNIETTFTLLSPQFQGENNSAILLQPPIDFACVGERFIHNPNAYDRDGDSLAYEMTIPKQTPGLDVPNYLFPNQISPGPENQIDLNEITGDFIWDAPQRVGEYNIAIKIKEYRNGLLINTIIRDMQILVQACQNDPPEIESEEMYCVVAGNTVEIPFVVTDPNQSQKVKVNALGGPFTQSINPAQLEAPLGYVDQPLSGKIVWNTACEHISDLPYTIVIRAEDNFLDTLGLSYLKTIRVKVIGPPPLDLQSQKINNGLMISWQKPYLCDITANDYLQGFSVWRRLNTNPFVQDSCTPGLDNQGYTQIGFDILTMEDGRYVFFDGDVESGKTYCYRVMAEFALLSSVGNPFNRIAGIPSEEICAQLNRDIPFILNVSVTETAQNDGKIFIKWTRPDPEDLDTIANPGPYTFKLKRSPDIRSNDYVEISGAQKSFPTFSDINDTTYMDSGLNTISSGYRYAIEFFTGNKKHGESQPASSVFLSVAGTDQANKLSWDFDVPWRNQFFTVYRENLQTGTFDSLGITSEYSYEDQNLQNGDTYCYYVKSTGTYGVTGIESPLLNLSQITCGVPVDSLPPCPPQLTVNNICNQAEPGTSEDQFVNELSWFINQSTCNRPLDVVGYRIYYALNIESEFIQIAEIDNAQTLVFSHQPDNGIAGCYAITSYDASNNESEFSNIFCLENCPAYKLPNTFTPNGDGFNDRFIPIANRFIDRIDFKVFNRWGQLVFETSDPEINWDGRNLKGKELAEGAYYYHCLIFEFAGTETKSFNEPLTGFIQLIRSKSN